MDGVYNYNSVHRHLEQGVSAKLPRVKEVPVKWAVSKIPVKKCLSVTLSSWYLAVLFVVVVVDVFLFVVSTSNSASWSSNSN